MYQLVLFLGFYLFFQIGEKKYYRYYYEKKIDKLSNRVYDSIAFLDSLTAPNDSLGYTRCFEANYKLNKQRSKLAFKDVKAPANFMLWQNYKFTDARHVNLNDKLGARRIFYTLKAVRAKLNDPL